MRALVLLLISFSSSLAFAGRDSVAVFHRPEKVVVLFTENFSRSTRILDLVGALGGSDSFELASADGSVRVRCNKSPDAGSCTLTFRPSPTVSIAPKTLSVSHPLTDLAPTAGSTEIFFESAQDDRVSILVDDGRFTLEASKR